MAICPILITAGAKMKMTGLGSHDAQVTFRQRLETGEAITLTKAFPGFTSAVDTVDRAGE